MLLFHIDSHVGSGGWLASLETPHTVSVPVKPVSSKVLVNALLLCRIDSHVGPVDDVRGGIT